MPSPLIDVLREVMSTEPTDTKKYKMMGKYSSEAQATAAMATMKECK
jgi:hypothetical protein